MFAVFETAAWLSDFAAEERLGTAPADEDAADMGVARKVAAARANKGDRENFIVNMCDWSFWEGLMYGMLLMSLILSRSGRRPPSQNNGRNMPK